MSNLSLFEKSIAKSELTHNLGCAVLLRAVEDYVGLYGRSDKNSMPSRYFDKAIIISDLKSDHMISLTDGMSLQVAEQLLSNSTNIKENIKKCIKDYALVRRSCHND